MSVRGMLALVAVVFAIPTGAAAEQASQPTSVAAGGLDVGAYHACALLPSASVRCWGYGADGALGYGDPRTIGDDETPAAAGPVELGAGRTSMALSAGSVHSCALLDDGTVRCWGFGGEGRLGYANTSGVGVEQPPGAVGPVDLGAGRTATAVTAGRAHTCAVLDNGMVRCWGFGLDGRLGYGNTNSIGDDETPGSVGPVRLGAGRTAKAITAGEAHTCALLDDGTVRCWGANASGQLGYGNTTPVGDDETPDVTRPVNLGPERTAVAVSAGSFHTCALLDNASVRCWGFAGNGQLGYGNISSIGDDETPDVTGPVNLGPGRTAKAISAGAFHTCALLDNATVRCWGFGRNGRLGYSSANSIGDDELPDTVGPVDLGDDRVVAISAGGDSTCARLGGGGGVRCWGYAGNGRLGSCSTNNVGDDENPGSVGPVDLGVPGSLGAGCTSAPPPASAPPGSSDAPPGPPALPSVAPDAMGASLAAQRARATALRVCLADISNRTSAELRRAEDHPVSKRAGAKRQIARNARWRRGCLKRHGRTPGRVMTLAAWPAGRRTIRLVLRATGTHYSRPPAATSYLIKQSSRPISTARDFRRAAALCKGACSFKVTQVGATLTLTVTDLRPQHTYHYAIAARDNVSGRVGRRSETVSARTP